MSFKKLNCRLSLFNVKSDYYRPIEFIPSYKSTENSDLPKWDYTNKDFKAPRGLHLYIPNNLSLFISINRFLQFFNYKSQNVGLMNDFWMLDGTHWSNSYQIDKDLKNLELNLNDNLYIYK